MNKLLKNGSINFLTLLVPSLLMLVSMPLLTNWLGIETFGLWVLCSTLLGLFGLLDFGLKEAAITFIPSLLAKKDAEGLKNHIHSLFSLNLIIGLFASLLLFVVAEYAATEVFHVQPKNTADTVLAFRVLSLGILPSLTINLFSAIAMGYQHFHLSSTLMVGRNILTTLGTLYFAALTGSLAPVIIFSVCVNWLCMLAGMAGLHRAVSLRMLLSIPPAKNFREVLSFGSLSFLTNVSSLAMGVFDKIFIGALLGPTAVAYYSVPLSLAARLEQVLVKFAQALFPHFSEVAAQKGDPASGSSRIYDLSFSATLFIGIGIGAGIIALSGPLLTLWMGEGFAKKSTWILRGLIVGHMFKMFNVVPSYILYSLRAPSKNFISYSLSGLIYIITIIVTARHVSLGLLSFSSLAYAVSFLLLYRGIKGNLNKGLKWHAISFLMASIPAAGLTSVIINQYRGHYAISTLLGGIAFSALYVGGCLLLPRYILPQERRGELNAALALSGEFMKKKRYRHLRS